MWKSKEPIETGGAEQRLYFLSHLLKILVSDPVPLLQRSVPSPGSQRKRSVGASNWSWRHWRPVWTSSPPATSCPASAPTLVYPSRCKWQPPTSPGKLWSSTWCLVGALFRWRRQPSTWRPRPLLRRRPRKVSHKPLSHFIYVKLMASSDC